MHNSGGCFRSLLTQFTARIDRDLARLRDDAAKVQDGEQLKSDKFGAVGDRPGAFDKFLGFPQDIRTIATDEFRMRFGGRGDALTCFGCGVGALGSSTKSSANWLARISRERGNWDAKSWTVPARSSSPEIRSGACSLRPSSVSYARTSNSSDRRDESRDRYNLLERRSEALVEQRQSALQPRVGLDSHEPLPLLGGFASQLVKKVFSGFAIFGLRFLRRDGDPPVRELKRIKRRLLFKTVAFGEVLSVALLGLRQMRLDPCIRRRPGLCPIPPAARSRKRTRIPFLVSPLAAAPRTSRSRHLQS